MSVWRRRRPRPHILNTHETVGGGGATFVHSYQPSFISKLQIKFAEFPYLLYFVSNRVYSTREPVADWSTEIEGSFRSDQTERKKVLVNTILNVSRILIGNEIQTIGCWYVDVCTRDWKVDKMSQNEFRINFI